MGDAEKDPMPTRQDYFDLLHGLIRVLEEGELTSAWKALKDFLPMETVRRLRLMDDQAFMDLVVKIKIKKDEEKLEKDVLRVLGGGPNTIEGLVARAGLVSGSSDSESKMRKIIALMAEKRLVTRRSKEGVEFETWALVADSTTPDTVDQK